MIHYDPDCSLEELQESFHRHLHNLDQVVSLLSGTLPSLCQSAVDIFNVAQDLEGKLKQQMLINQRQSEEMAAKVQDLEKQVQSYRKKMELSPIIEKESLPS